MSFEIIHCHIFYCHRFFSTFLSYLSSLSLYFPLTFHVSHAYVRVGRNTLLYTRFLTFTETFLKYIMLERALNDLLAFTTLALIFFPMLLLLVICTTRYVNSDNCSKTYCPSSVGITKLPCLRLSPLPYALILMGLS